MKAIIDAKVLNPFRSHVPAGFYDKVKGHTGVDLDYNFEDIPAPCDLTIILCNPVKNQPEMGNVIYARSQDGLTHVFAHQADFIYVAGDKVLQGAILGHSGNSGGKTTGAHLHYEVLAPSGTDPTMKRLLLPYKGDNVDPLEYLHKLYTAQKATDVLSDVQKQAILDHARQNRLKRAFSLVKNIFTK